MTSPEQPKSGVNPQANEKILIALAAAGIDINGARMEPDYGFDPYNVGLGYSPQPVVGATTYDVDQEVPITIFPERTALPQ